VPFVVAGAIQLSVSVPAPDVTVPICGADEGPAGTTVVVVAGDEPMALFATIEKRYEVPFVSPVTVAASGEDGATVATIVHTAASDPHDAKHIDTM
jgi:hypothetical protein